MRSEVQNDDGRKGLKQDKVMLDWRVVLQQPRRAVGESSADKELQLGRAQHVLAATYIRITRIPSNAKSTDRARGYTTPTPPRQKCDDKLRTVWRHSMRHSCFWIADNQPCVEEPSGSTLSWRWPVKGHYHQAGKSTAQPNNSLTATATVYSHICQRITKGLSTCWYKDQNVVHFCVRFYQ